MENQHKENLALFEGMLDELHSIWRGYSRISNAEKRPLNFNELELLCDLRNRLVFLKNQFMENSTGDERKEMVKIIKGV